MTLEQLIRDKSLRSVVIFNLPNGQIELCAGVGVNRFKKTKGDDLEDCIAKMIALLPSPKTTGMPDLDDLTMPDV